jgi:hypothetical protein
MLAPVFDVRVLDAPELAPEEITERHVRSHCDVYEDVEPSALVIGGRAFGRTPTWSWLRPGSCWSGRPDLRSPPRPQYLARYGRHAACPVLVFTEQDAYCEDGEPATMSREEGTIGLLKQLEESL